MSKSKHKQKDPKPSPAELLEIAQQAAYCVLPYRDTVTGRLEMVWNSRVGLIFQEITSLEGNPAQLEIGGLTTRIPPDQYKPQVGDRIIVDMTPVRARVLANEIIDKAIADGEAAELESRFASRAEAVEAMAGTMLRQFNADLLVVTDGYLRELEAPDAPDAQLAPDAPDVPDVILGSLGEIRPSDAVLEMAVRAYLHRHGVRNDDDNLTRELMEDLAIKFFDRTGRQLDVEQWRALHDNDDGEHVVKHTLLWDRTEGNLHTTAKVCTDWLGVDCGDGKVFVTIAAITATVGGLEIYDRGISAGGHKTLDEALKAHKDVCSKTPAFEEVHARILKLKAELDAAKKREAS